MKEKIKGNNYFYWGATLFCSIGASILLYFVCLRFEDILNGVVKIIEILAPILLGLLFAYLLNPFVRMMERKVFSKFCRKCKRYIKDEKKTSRILSIFCTYFLAAVVLFLFIKFVLPSLFESLEMMITNIPIYINNIYEYLKDILKNNPELAASIENINTDITEGFKNIVVPSMDTIMLNLTAGITSLVNGIIDCIIAFIVSIYLLYDKESFIANTKKAMKALIPKKAYDYIMTTLGYTDKIFGGFMIAKIIDSLIIGVLTFIIISIFKIPYALIIAVIVGVTNIIPYFGPFIGAIPCAALLLLIDPKKCVTFVILIFLIQQFDGNILGPKLIGNKTGIKSFWVLFSILLFGGLFGFIGMIFGVPIFAVIYSMLATTINKKLDKKSAK